MAQSKLDIFNVAITLLGGLPVASVTQNNRAVTAMNTVYEMLRRGELRKRPAWNFAIKQVQLAASADTPLFDKAYSYPLPGDFLAMAVNFPESNFNDIDYQIQGSQIYSQFNAPLNIRYVYDVTEVGQFDPLFSLALSAKLAFTCADAITQSGNKVQLAAKVYDQAYADAARANALDNASRQFPDDPWITVRL